MYQLQTRAKQFGIWIVQGDESSNLSEEFLREFQQWKRDKGLQVRIVKVDVVVEND